MRILHVIPHFPYFGGRTIVGGHASCLLTLALAQHAAGDQVTVLSYTEGQSGSIHIDDGPPVFSLFERAARPGTVSFGLRFRHAAVRWARARRGAFDVVHCHSGFADYVMVSHRLKSVLRVPTLHTLYCPIPRQGGRWHRPIVRGMIRRWASELDAVVAMSENTANSMRRYGVPRVQTIPPAVDIDRFCRGGDSSSLRAELGIASEDVAVLFVGNALPQKNMSGVLRGISEARKIHNNIKLIVTTELRKSSSEKNLELLRQEKNDLNLESCTTQMGIVNNMAELMQACDLLIAPFLDTLGPSDYFMAVLEAMACGKPTIVSSVGGMPEVISEKVGLLVDPHDHMAIAAALAAYAGDTAARSAAGAHACRYARQHFDPQRIVRAYRDVYVRVTS